jgi:HTH-type transcriptional regulator / antitoxin HigA
MSTKYDFKPDYAFHPGETLEETLETLAMSQAELAQRTGRPLKTINEIIQGKAAITADTALQLERATGVPATFWNNAQRNYEAALARQAEAQEIERGIEWLKNFPIKTLIRFGWLKKAENQVDQMRELLGFFGVAGVAEWESIWSSPQAVFRKSTAFEAQPTAVAAWLREGEREAQRLETQPFDRKQFTDALIEVRKLTNREPEDFEPAMKLLCAACGVAMVFLPELPGTRAYGATRWLSPEKAILQLSLRGKTDDLLWFTFFHEAAHILKHGKKDVFIEAKKASNDKSILQKEEEADSFAADFLIPRIAFRDLLSRQPFTAGRICAFAKDLGIAPGIVVGRLQHEQLIQFNQFYQLKRRLCFKEES